MIFHLSAACSILQGLEHLRPGSSSQTVCADFYAPVRQGGRGEPVSIKPP